MSLRNPVKYPVKYYSWNDAQAPRLSNVDGVIKTILKACLVTGYGSKAGAGWTSLFEDDYRIVLRRPLRTGNPPDIKIENGVINGATSHRVVFQNQPLSLDDTAELSSFNLLARSPGTQPEWHCIVTDFAFLLCYRMGIASSTTNNHALFIGSPQRLNDADEDYHIANRCHGVGTDGQMGSYSEPSLFSFNSNKANNLFINQRTSATYSNYNYQTFLSTEKAINNDFFAVPVIINGLFKMPIFVNASGTNLESTTSQIISISGRNFLRYFNGHQNGDPKALYIPLDYWEV